MQLFSYTPHVVQGPAGRVLRYTPAVVNDVELTYELGPDASGRVFVVAPDATSIPGQPVDIAWQPEALTPERETWLASNRRWGTFLAAKAAKQHARVQALEAARGAGFSHGGHVVDSTIASQLLIEGAASRAQRAVVAGTQGALDAFAAQLGAGWRGKDGTIVATTAQDILDLSDSLANHVATCDAVSQAHKAAIEAAETPSQLAAIDVSAGY